MFNIFKKKSTDSPGENSLTVEEFCEIINNGGEINILKIFNTPLGIFSKATQAQINSNLEDKRNGVIEVYFNSNVHVFGIFTSIVFKIYKDGSKQYFLHITTQDAELVQKTANSIYKHLGEGNFNENKFSSFREYNNILNIAKGNVFSEKDECVNWWTGKHDNLIKYALYLQYRVNPLQQFILNINESSYKG